MFRTRLVLTVALLVAALALSATPASAQRPKRGNPGGGFGGDIEHHMDPNGWQPANNQPKFPKNQPKFPINQPNFPNNNKGMEDAEKAAQSAGRAITGGMIAMGIVSLLFGVAILGGTGFLVMKSGQVADGSAAGGSRRRKRSRD